MTRFAAFLRGVNLGKRQVKSADLKAAFDAMGFTEVKTLLASGNVLFDADSPDNLRATIEAGLKSRFGFEIGTVLRTLDELADLIASDPFGGLVEDKDTKLYVTFLPDPLAVEIPADIGVPGDFDVARVSEREIFLVGHRQPNGRFSEGMQAVHKLLGKALYTSRNYNTVLKAAS